MRYDDLLGIPYKEHGRSKEEGFDCYGVCVEMCKRDGKKLKDPYTIAHLASDKVSDYISGKINIRKIDRPIIGGLVECTHKGSLHAGYIVGRGLMIHATIDKGVRVTPIAAMKPIAYYEVTDESDIV